MLPDLSFHPPQSPQPHEKENWCHGNEGPANVFDLRQCLQFQDGYSRAEQHDEGAEVGQKSAFVGQVRPFDGQEIADDQRILVGGHGEYLWGKIRPALR